jgi:hypothetical protein
MISKKYAKTYAAFGAMLLAGIGSVQAQTAVATYKFNNSLAAEEGGVPSLVAIDPLGLNSFETAIVNGSSQQVYRWDGNGADPITHAGLLLDATGLVPYDNYSIEMIFEFTEHAQFGGGWRRIVDTQNRQSDNGFYVAPENVLEVYPVVDGVNEFTTSEFHHVVLTNYVIGGTKEVKAYLDGVLELTSDTDQLNLDNANNPGHLLNFFADNLVGGAEHEFADGRIAYLRLYSGIITPTDVPEPGSIGLLAGFAVAGTLAFRRRRK